jgi:hypothetical protein
MVFVAASPSDEVIEQLDLTVQFPGNIASYRFGAGNAAVFPGGSPERVWMAGFALGRDENGECTIKQAAIAPIPELTATIAGAGMVRMHGVRISPNTTAMGYFALSEKPPNFHPASMYTEGHYEYQRFGFTVSKPLPITNTGVHDAK